MVILSLIELHLRKMNKIRYFGDPSRNVRVLHQLQGILTTLSSSIDGPITKIMVENQLPRHLKWTL